MAVVVYSGSKSRLQFICDSLNALNVTTQHLELAIKEGQVTRNSTRILWVELGVNIDSDLIKMFPNLILIISATTGLSHIDVEYSSLRGIEVKSLRDFPELINQITSTGEYTWTLALAVWRKLIINLYDAAEEPIKELREKNKAIQLKGKQVGIIGLGRVGKLVANYASAFGMKVLWFDPFVNSYELLPNKSIIKVLSLKELLETSDIITLTASYKKGDPEILDQAAVKTIKPGAIVINTARGSLWNENAVARALEAGLLGGVGVDVYAYEDNLGNARDMSPLLNIDAKKHNLVATPHIGGATEDALMTIMNVFCQFVYEYLQSRAD